MRSYVLSYTIQIFLTSYETPLVGENLAEKGFNEKTGSDGDLVDSMRNMTLNRDENAPIDPTADNLTAFEELRDMTEFFAKAKAAQQDNDIKKVIQCKGRPPH